VAVMKSVNSDVAYAHIRKRILNGEYPPNHALTTKELSKEIGVSRTPVRDALRQLETDGLVSIRPRLGASVKAMNLTEFREMCGLRLALESYAAGLAAQHRTEADLLEIRFALENMRRLTEEIVTEEDEPRLLGELIREDVRFHIAIMMAAKSDLLKKEILRLHLINRVVSGTGGSSPIADLHERAARRRVVLNSHEEIFRALESGDTPAAKNAMDRHIQDIIDMNVRTMSRMARELTEDELSYTT